MRVSQLALYNYVKKLENHHIHDCIVLISSVYKRKQWFEHRAVL